MRRLSTRHSRGLTIIELAAVLALAGVVLAGAVAAGMRFADDLWPVRKSLGVKPRAVALRDGVTAWYRAEYCGLSDKLPRRLGEPVHRSPAPPAFPLQLAHAPPPDKVSDDAIRACNVRIVRTSCAGEREEKVERTSCVAAHVAPHLQRLLLSLAPSPTEESRHGSFAWEIVTYPSPSPTVLHWPRPQLRVFWHPPAGLQERIPEVADMLARELGAYCDDDGNADTSEACDGVPTAGASGPFAERFVWAGPIGAFEAEAGRRIRLREWLAAHAVDCNADRTPFAPGLDVMDPFCDGPTNNERIPIADEPDAEDRIHVIDVDGDECDDAHGRPPLDGAHPRHHTDRTEDDPRRTTGPCFSPALLDKDKNCKLDFDVTGDFIVDRADFYALGC